MVYGYGVGNLRIFNQLETFISICLDLGLNEVGYTNCDFIEVV